MGLQLVEELALPKSHEQFSALAVVLVKVTQKGVHPAVSEVKLITGRGFTVTLRVSVAVHPLASVTVTV